jgi:hypothetical protein
MLRKNKWIFLMILSFLMFSKVFAAVPYEISGNIATYSDYVWRGQVLDDDPSCQTGLSLGVMDVSLNMWVNSPLKNSEDYNNAQEIDYTLSYGKDVSISNVQLHTETGFIYYDFLNSYAKEGYAKIGISDYFVSYYCDFTNDDNLRGYVAFDGSYRKRKFNLAGRYGLYSNSLGSEFEVKLSYDFVLSNTTVSPVIGYAVPFGNLKDFSEQKVFVGLVTSFGL